MLHTQKKKNHPHTDKPNQQLNTNRKRTLKDTSTLVIQSGVVYHTSANILFIQVKVPGENIDPAD